MPTPMAAYRPPPTEALRTMLEDSLAAHFGDTRTITALTRSSSPYRSSFALEEVAVQRDDGGTLALIFKETGWTALTAEAQRSKPPFLHHPEREIAVYRTLLADAAVGTATCYGALSDRRHDRYWLFLEHVTGAPLYAVGDFAVWEAAARWLATLHARFAGVADTLTRRELHLVRYGAPYYRRWLRRARPALAAVAREGATDEARRIGRLCAGYDRIVARLVALPVTLLHGEFYASNILADIAHSRICPIDWEMAAVGPGLIDLAALIAGSWTEAQKMALADAYYDERRRTNSFLSHDAFLDALACCRLHVALQWLGWSPGWMPPPEQTQDWASEACEIANVLGL